MAREKFHSFQKNWNCWECQTRCGWSPVPGNLAERQIGDLMLEFYSTAKDNNIDRNGKAQRGFRNVRFRSACED